MRDFWGDHSFETQFQEILRKKFLRNSLEFFPKRFLRFSINTSPEIPVKFLGLGHHVFGILGEFNREIVLRNYWGVSLELILPQEIPENFSRVFLRKVLRNS